MYYQKCLTLDELMTNLRGLSSFIQAHPNVGIIGNSIKLAHDH